MVHWGEAHWENGIEVSSVRVNVPNAFAQSRTSAVCIHRISKVEVNDVKVAQLP